MAFSVFEQRDQLLALEKRRAEIAAQGGAVQQAEPAAPASAAVTAGVMLAAGYGTPAVALKGAEANAGKRRKAKNRDRAERDMQAEDPAGTAAVAEGYRDAMEAEAAARKTFSERGATASRGDSMQPDGLRPESAGRPYLEAGHASDAPTAEPPRTNPLPMTRHYVPPSEPAVARLDPNVMGTYSLGSPSE